MRLFDLMKPDCECHKENGATNPCIVDTESEVICGFCGTEFVLSQTRVGIALANMGNDIDNLNARLTAFLLGGKP